MVLNIPKEYLCEQSLIDVTPSAAIKEKVDHLRRFEYEGEEFDWKVCEKPGCQNQICLALNETKYCYPHSKWYRPITRYFNQLITTLFDKDK